MATRHRLQASLDRSQVGETLRTAAATSSAVDSIRRIVSPMRETYRNSGGVDRWTRTSGVLGTARTLRRTFETAAQTAAITRAGRTLASWTRTSFLYRWLTREPDPEVIVIDLRETVTVGPIIALLDHIIEAFVPSARRSALVESLTATGQAIRDAPVRAFSLVVLVVTVVNLLATLLLVGFDPAGVALRILVVGAAAVGTRVTMSWEELRHTRVGQLVAAALAPPEPIEDSAEESRPERE